MCESIVLNEGLDEKLENKIGRACGKYISIFAVKKKKEGAVQQVDAINRLAV